MNLRHLAPTLLAIASPLAAATVPTGYQDFRVIGNEDHVWNILQAVAVGEGSGSFDNGAGFLTAMNSVVTLTASADSQIVMYDHWEDGFELEANLIGLTPAQATSLILGDGNNANGRACDFTTDPNVAPCNGTNDDVLFQGTELTFNSNQSLPTCPTGAPQCIARQPVPAAGNACAAAIPAAPADRRCSVPLPRNPAHIRYDGADRLITSGGPISLVHTQDPLSPFIGGASEVIPRQAVENAVSYTIPIGQDLYGGNDTPGESLKYVFLELAAYEDGTNISINSPGVGVINFTLDTGQHYSSRGFIDSTTAPAITINAGTKVSTSAPISGMVLTGGDGTFSTRFYLLLPDVLHGTDYVTTAPGDDPALQGNRPLNLFIINPDQVNAITVSATDTVGTRTFNIPAGAAVNYFNGAAPNRYVPTGSTVRLTSNRLFWGISAYDSQSPANDWGHSWIATRFLQDTYTVSYAPGVNNPAFQSLPAQRTANDVDCTPPANVNCDSLNRSAVFVAATQNNTRVQVDLDADGIFDIIDVNSDDVPDPANVVPTNPPPGWANGPDATTYIINELRALRIYDHTDYDNTGTIVVADKPVALSWGQDTDQAIGGDPILDTGYTVFQANVEAVLTIEKTADPVSVPTTGGVVDYTITIDSGDVGSLTAVSASDFLPAGVVCADFVTSSSLVTYPNFAQDASDPGCTDNYMGTGRSLIEWVFDADLNTPAIDPYTLAIDLQITIHYQIDIPAGPSGILINTAEAQGTLNGSVFRPTDTAEVTRTDVSIAKSVAVGGSGIAVPGTVLTYTLNVLNAGIAAETNVIILDAIPPDTTYVPASATGAGPFSATYLPGSNSVQFSAANFPVGGPHALTFQVTINPTANAGDIITNVANYGSVQTPFLLSNEVETPIAAPALTITKTGTPGPLYPGQVVSYELVVTNTGSANATNVTLTDPIATNSTYVPGSMTWRLNALPFAAVTDAADADPGTLLAAPARTQLTVASLGPGQSITFRFNVTVNLATVGQFLANQAITSAAEVDPVDSNLYQQPIVAPITVTHHVFLDLDGDGVQDPGEPDLPNVSVEVTAPNGNVITVVTDVNGDWTATLASSNECYEDTLPTVGYAGSTGLLPWAATPWVEVLTGADGNPTTTPLNVSTAPFGAFGNSLTFGGGQAAPGRGFTRQLNLSTFDNGYLRFDWATQNTESGAGDDDLFVELDYDNNGTFEHSIATIDGGTNGAWQATANLILTGAAIPANPVTLRFRWVSTAANETFWVDNVRLCDQGTITVDVDEDDPDIPAGATISTPGGDPQVVVVNLAGTTVVPDTGYEPAAIVVTKESDVVGSAAPGQVITYTVTVRNDTGIEQTNVVVSDPLPAGTSYVAASGSVRQNTYRIREYEIAAGAFTGATFNLDLAYNLSTNYFVLIQGSSNVSAGPDDNYVAVTGDPFPSGDLAASGAPNRLVLTRNGTDGNWVGVVTVVECTGDCAASGFQKLDVQRVSHTGTTTSGSDSSTVNWTASRVMLLGGYRGGGCNSTATANGDHPSCQVRFEPTGTNTINWTRSSVTGDLATATSTVQVIEWGTDWNVQNVRVTGSNFGDGVDIAGEYNTTAVTSRASASTWVWGTGFTADNGAGDSGSGIVYALGSGVSPVAGTITSVAAGSEFNDARDAQVWVMTHPNLLVDHVFKADGDAGVNPVNVPVDSAAAAAHRFALHYNGLNSTGTGTFAQGLQTARYSTPTTVQLGRAINTSAFPAWVQGIDFSGITHVAGPSGAPPNLVTALDGYDLAPGCILTVTYQVQVNDPLAGSISTIDNTATASTDLEGPVQDDTSDPVVYLGVVVEYNNAAFAEANFPSPQVLTFAHDVVNTGNVSDSYDIVVESELGWRVELVDPATGTVLAIDLTGDGTWDVGGPINTGLLAPGSRRQYDIRVTVPASTPLGTQETVRMLATSDLNSSVTDFSTDEIEVVDVSSVGPVDVLPDNSGVVNPDGSVAYAHYVINNTGGNATFDLTAVNVMNGAANPPGWSATIYGDTNFDGVYTPGVDLPISNTANLPDGASQQFFVVVDSPPSALPGDTVVTVINAVQQGQPSVFDGAGDTTTVVLPDSHDLAGGGTRLVQGGDVAVFPGTLFNQGSVSDTFELSISPSAFFGLDPYLHPTELWVDTTADGIPDTLIASDTDGDGDWDFILGGVGGPNDPDADGLPQLVVPGGAQLAYELRRATDPLQTTYRDLVTLTAVSANSGDSDSISAINLLPALTDAVVSSFDARRDSGRLVLRWSTASEVGTAGFEVYRRAAGQSNWRRVADRVVPALLHHPQGGSYRLVDPAPGSGLVEYQLVELLATGLRRLLGSPMATDLSKVPADESSLTGSGAFETSPHQPSPERRAGVELASKAVKAPGTAARIATRGNGLVRVTASDLAATLQRPVAEIQAAIAQHGVALFRLGEPVAWLADGSDIVFLASTPSSIYSADDVVQLRLEPGLEIAGAASLVFADDFETGDISRWSGDGSAAGVILATAVGEQDNYPVTSTATDPDGDFWHWEVFFAGDVAKSVSVATPAPLGSGSASVRVWFQGFSSTPAPIDHRARVEIGGTVLGTVSWNGANVAQGSFAVPSHLLGEGSTSVTIVPEKPAGVDFAIFYLDRIEIDYARRSELAAGRLDGRHPGAGTHTVAGLGTAAIAIDATTTNTPHRLGVNGTEVEVPAGVERLFVADLESAAAPESLTADSPSDLRASSNRSSYLVIAGAGLEPAAQALAALRVGDGFESMVVAIEDVYDEFAFGAVDPLAVQRLLTWAHQNWSLAPHHVVLFGDGSFDYKDRFGVGENLVFAPMVASASGLVPSDQRLADIDGDGLLDVAIGRIPVRFSDQGFDYVANLQARDQTPGSWSTTAIWVADNPDFGGEFPVDLGTISAAAPATWTDLEVDRSRLDTAPARAALIDAIGDGAAYVTFLGHGGIDRLADEGLLRSTDVGSIGNGAERPVVAAMTCSVGRSDLPGQESLTEELLLGADGGAIAVISPTARQLNSDGVAISKLYFGGVPSDGTVGEALVAALRAFVLTGGDAAMARSVALVGDPAAPYLPGAGE